VCTQRAIAAIEQATDALRVVGETGEAWQGGHVLICVGVRPAGGIAAAAGASIGERGAIRVDRQMATSLDAVWAAGDYAETHHRILDRAAYIPLGTTAHKQGRIAGENAIGGRRRFEGSLGTQVVKVFDRSSEVAKRIDTAARALHAGLEVDEINDLDLSYAPLGSPWDALQRAAQQWRTHARDRRVTAAGEQTGRHAEPLTRSRGLLH
jgi:pyruvate/2-oxoglutarate dehydrogenase complex dihydrolipoamide dehydrogenase (E3) component